MVTPTVFGPYAATLLRTEVCAAETDVFYFTKPENFSFLAGQYVTMCLPDPAFTDARGAARPLSIASAPSDDVLAFAWRRSESAFKRSMAALVPGDSVEIKGPFGRFLIPEDQAVPVVFLIGGIGITPARSIIRQAAHDGVTRDITLVYSNKTTEDAPFFTEFADSATAGCRVVHTLTDLSPDDPWDGERGFIDAVMVRRRVPSWETAHFYIVGPGAFVAAMRQVVADLGVGADRLTVDDFGGAPRPQS